MEKKWHMVHCGDELLINKVTTVGEVTVNDLTIHHKT